MLRGVAALIVVLHHFLLIFYPALLTTLPEHKHTLHNTEAQWSYSLLSFLWNGHFAVSIFFVLSGYVLSLGYFSRNDMTLPSRSALQRYPRLVLPVAVSILLGWLLLRMNAFVNISTAQIYTKSEFWFSNLWRIQPDLLAALKEAFIEVPFYGGTLEYNPVLWTINIELIGSLLVFALLALTGQLRNRWVIYIILCVLLHRSHLAAFILGTALADYRCGTYFRPLNRYVVLLPVLLGVYAGSFHWLKFFPHSEWGPVSYMTGTLARNVYTGGAAVLLLCAVNRTTEHSLRATRMASWAGRMSFGLYLLHLLFIGTASCRVFTALYELHIGYHWSVVLTLTGTLAVLIPLSLLYHRFVDRPSIRIARYIAQRAFHQKSAL